MNATLSSRQLALLAVCLAVTSGIFCWRWAARYSAKVDRIHREIAVVEEKQDDVEFHVLNMAALLVRGSENPSHRGRLLPTDPLFARQCADIASSMTSLRTFETVRANTFLLWYHRQMQERHFEQPPVALTGESKRPADVVPGFPIGDSQLARSPGGG